MEIKVTPTAMEELDHLAAGARKEVLHEIRTSLPSKAAEDPVFDLQELGTTVRAHTVGNSGHIVLYRLDDVDHDKEEEAIVLMLISRDVLDNLGKLTTTHSKIDYPLLASAPNATRIGRELLSKISSVENA